MQWIQNRMFCVRFPYWSGGTAFEPKISQPNSKRSLSLSLSFFIQIDFVRRLENNKLQNHFEEGYCITNNATHAHMTNESTQSK